MERNMTIMTVIGDNTLGQVIHTDVLLSPSSIIWYWSECIDVLWLGRWPRPSRKWLQPAASFVTQSRVGWLPENCYRLRPHSYCFTFYLLIHFTQRNGQQYFRESKKLQQTCKWVPVLWNRWVSVKWVVSWICVLLLWMRYLRLLMTAVTLEFAAFAVIS